jgi:hypothetical protein
MTKEEKRMMVRRSELERGVEVGWHVDEGKLVALLPLTSNANVLYHSGPRYSQKR